MATFLHVVHAGDERAEIKLLVQHNKIAEARRALNLATTAEKHYKVYFVDTAHFDLNNVGLILRLRNKGNGSVEATVKFRPTDSSKRLGEEWRTKLEKEDEWLIGKGENLSYSLKHEMDGMELLKKPRENLKVLFSDEQKALFKQIMDHKFDSAELKVFGPIAAEIWEWKEAAVDDKVSAELWELGNERVFELSRKTKANNLKEKAKDFEKAFKRKGIVVDPEPQSKTRKALEYYSHLHGKQAAHEKRAVIASGTSAHPRSCSSMAFFSKQTD